MTTTTTAAPVVVQNTVRAATEVAAVARTPTGRALVDQAKKGASDIFPNQLPNMLVAELQAAASVGAGPIRAGAPGFFEALNSGTIKWIVTQANALIVSPHSVKGVEISHAVLSGGESVLAAGQAEIAAVGGQVVGLNIVPWSGHSMPSEGSLQIGIDAFSRFGIQF